MKSWCFCGQPDSLGGDSEPLISDVKTLENVSPLGGLYMPCLVNDNLSRFIEEEIDIMRRNLGIRNEE